MRQIPIAVIVFLAALTCLAVAGEAPDARNLNDQGYELYEAGKFAEALTKFQAAVKADTAYAMAHYNLACTYGALRKQNLACDYEAHRDVIMEHLTAACRLDPRRLRKMKKDADLDCIRDTYGYQLLLGLTPDNSANVRQMVQAVTWWGPQPLAETLSSIDFKPDGSFTLEINGYVGSDGPTGTFSGTFTVHATQLVLMLKRPLAGRKRIVGELIDGALRFPGIPGPFTDSPEECNG